MMYVIAPKGYSIIRHDRTRRERQQGKADLFILHPYYFKRFHIHKLVQKFANDLSDLAAVAKDYIY